MKNVTVHLLTRGCTYLQPVVRALVPHVSKILIAIDHRATLETQIALDELALAHRNLALYTVSIRNPFVDLVAARNMLVVHTETPYVWVVDDDELYQLETIRMVEKTLERNPDAKAFALKFWDVWNKEQAHRAYSNIWTVRLAKKTEKLYWKGVWGKECLYDGEERLARKECAAVVQIPARYIHLTRLKGKSLWREEMGQTRRPVVNPKMIPLPDDVRRMICSL